MWARVRCRRGEGRHGQGCQVGRRAEEATVTDDVTQTTPTFGNFAIVRRSSTFVDDTDDDQTGCALFTPSSLGGLCYLHVYALRDLILTQHIEPEHINEAGSHRAAVQVLRPQFELTIISDPVPRASTVCSDRKEETMICRLQTS